MQIKSLLISAAAATTVLATPTWGSQSGDGRVNGYPWGWSQCLNDQQSNFIVQSFKSILTNPDRKAAVATANGLLAVNYKETSDSINVLAGQPQGGVSFLGRDHFVQSVGGAPAVGSMQDLDVITGCNKIVWQWLANGIGMNVSPVKGFNKITVDVSTGRILATDLEFNAIAWGRDIGWTCTAPPAQ